MVSIDISKNSATVSEFRVVNFRTVVRIHWRSFGPSLSLKISVSQPLGRGINYTGPREVLLEFVILVF